MKTSVARKMIVAGVLISLIGFFLAGQARKHRVIALDKSNQISRLESRTENQRDLDMLARGHSSVLKSIDGLNSLESVFSVIKWFGVAMVATGALLLNRGSRIAVGSRLENRERYQASLVINEPSQLGSDATNKCPFCAEVVLRDAVLCKHCRSEL